MQSLPASRSFNISSEYYSFNISLVFVFDSIQILQMFSVSARHRRHHVEDQTTIRHLQQTTGKFSQYFLLTANLIFNESSYYFNQ